LTLHLLEEDRYSLVTIIQMDRVQLGTLHLDLRAGGEVQEPYEANSTWFRLTPDFINAGLLTNLSTSDELVALLSELLDDPGIGFEADCRVGRPHLVVRCSLISSDGRGGDWRKKPRKDRAQSLRRLFNKLKNGWDGEGDWILAKRVSHLVKHKLMSRKKTV
jgi:hypothetical protein